MKRMLFSTALAVAALCASAPASSAIVLSFTPSTTHIAIGGSVVIDVSISGLGAEVLSSVDLNFLFGTTATGNTAGNFSGLIAALGGNASFNFDPLNPGGGEVGLIAASFLDDATLAAQQLDSFSLGTLTFAGIANGITNIGLGLDPATQRKFLGLNDQALDVQVGSACISVGTASCNVVPEPASYGLVGIGLLAAGWVSRTRRRGRVDGQAV